LESVFTVRFGHATGRSGPSGGGAESFDLPDAGTGIGTSTLAGVKVFTAAKPFGGADFLAEFLRFAAGRVLVGVDGLIGRLQWFRA